MSDLRNRFVTDLGLVTVALIWGVNFAVMKVVLSELGPLALNALRFPMAAAALAIAVAMRSGPLLPDRSDLPRILVLGVIGNVVYQLCFIIGLDRTLAGNASLVLATTPAWTLVLSVVAGHEALTRGTAGGVAATLVGIALVVLGRGDALGVGVDTLAGDGLMLCAAMLWAIYTVAGRDPVQRYGSLRMTTWTLWVGTPVLVGLGLPELATTELASVSTGAWLGVVYAGLLSIGLAYVLWYRGVRHLGNSRTAVYSNLVPVAALITAWIWLGEVPTRLQLLGAAIILVGVTVARRPQTPESAEGGSSAPTSRDASWVRWRISGNS